MGQACSVVVANARSGQEQVRVRMGVEQAALQSVETGEIERVCSAVRFLSFGLTYRNCGT